MFPKNCHKKAPKIGKTIKKNCHKRLKSPPTSNQKAPKISRQTKKNSKKKITTKNAKIDVENSCVQNCLFYIHDV